MVIGFDLDRVFINYPPLVPGAVIDWLYKNHTSSKLSYRIPTSKLEIAVRQLSHLPIFRPPISQNIDFVSDLSKFPEHTLFLVSSRYGFLGKITWKILEKYHLISPFRKIYLNSNNEQAHLFKERIIKQEKIELFIDDDSDLLNYLKTTTPQVKLFHCCSPDYLNNLGQLLA